MWNYLTQICLQKYWVGKSYCHLSISSLFSANSGKSLRPVHHQYHAHYLSSSLFVFFIITSFHYHKYLSLSLDSSVHMYSLSVSFISIGKNTDRFLLQIHCLWGNSLSSMFFHSPVCGKTQAIASLWQMWSWLGAQILQISARKYLQMTTAHP